MLLGVSVRMVDVIPAHGRPVNARLHLMPYAIARRAPALRPWMGLAIAMASLTNRWGADLLPEEFAQVLRDWRAPDDFDPRNFCFAAAAAAQWGFPAWVAYGDLALLRAEMRAGCGAVVTLQSGAAQVAAGVPERRCVTVRPSGGMFDLRWRISSATPSQPTMNSSNGIAVSQSKSFSLA